jgi:hypothetical protein
VEAAREAGVNLAFLSGNEVFWKTRWEDSIDGTGTTYRTLVTYKETHANAVIDPLDPPIWTGTWMDPRFSPPADGGRPQNRLIGQLFTVNCCTYQMQASAPYAALRLWRGTRVAALTGSQTTTLGSDLLGYEWDTSPDNGFRPPGLIHLSSTTVNGAEILQDYGSNYARGTATHNLSLYRAPSGALVFGAGTVQWVWGLDAEHDPGAREHLRRRGPAGDGQRARRHGVSARHFAVRTRPREPEHGHDSADLGHHVPGERLDRGGQPAVDDQRNRH